MGNPWRRDDGAGLEVARRVGGLVIEGECTGLVDLFDGVDSVVVVDACASGAEPGTIMRFDVTTEPLPTMRGLRSSTHAFGAAEAIELARSLSRLPESVVVYAIEGADFAPGRELSAPVTRAVDALADELGAG